MVVRLRTSLQPHLATLTGALKGSPRDPRSGLRLGLAAGLLVGSLTACSGGGGGGGGFPNPADPDGDGLPTSLEQQLGSDPNDANDPFLGGDLDVVDEDGPGGDGITDGLENYILSVGSAGPITATSDLDGDDIPDYLEVRASTSLTSSDEPFAFGASDVLNDSGPTGDDIKDGLERFLIQFGARGPVTLTSDTDGDGISDVLEVRTGTNPFNKREPGPGEFLDVDGDGIPDYFEILNNFDPFNGDQPVVSGGDDQDGGVTGPDGDGISDGLEFAVINQGAIAPITARTDTDGDGLPDVLEVAIGSSLLDSDAPVVNGGGDTNNSTGPAGDGVSDALEFYLRDFGAKGPVDLALDSDGDRLTDVLEARSGTNPQDAADPDPFRQADVDADGISDVREVSAGTDPLDKDDPVLAGDQDIDDTTGPASDRFSDGLEGALITLGAMAPVTAQSDTDADGVPDWIENLRFSDPTDANSPRTAGGSDSSDTNGPGGDGISDALEDVLVELGALAPVGVGTDSDGDGIGDVLELRVGTNPFEALDPVPNFQLDIDADGAPDYLELVFGSDSQDVNDPVAMGSADSDLDRVSDAFEAVLAGLGAVQPVGPNSDSDGDGLADVLEVALGSDFLDSDQPVLGGLDTDDTTGPSADGLSDAFEAYLIASGADAPVTRRTDLDLDGAPGYLETIVGGGVNDDDSPVASGGLDTDMDNVTDALELVLTELGALAPVDGLTDSDADGAPDYLEVRGGGLPFDATDPADNGAADGDGDGLSDGLETTLLNLGANAPVSARSDTDGDSIPDYLEVQLGGDPIDASDPIVSGDLDTNDATGPAGDTLADGLEQVLIDAGAMAPVGLGTDTDDDGAPDYLEVISFDDFLDGNAPVVNGSMDTDGDTLSDAVEAVLVSLGGTAPLGIASDTDTDGAPDYFELQFGGHPVDSNHPALAGGGAADTDDSTGPPADGISDALEAILVANGSIPIVGAAADNDADGLPDYLEVRIASDVFDANDPTAGGGADSNDSTGPSGDGISDALEAYLISLGATGPITTSTDSDNDGVPDWIEIFEGSDPFDQASVPGFGTRPRAESVSIVGAQVIGREIFGTYNYVDNDGDPEGATMLQWYRDNVAIPGATTDSLVINPLDIGTTLRFEVIPVSDFAFPSSTAVGFASSGSLVLPSLEFPIGGGGPGGIAAADGQSGLELWYRAEIGVNHGVIGGNDIVTRWQDQSGNGRDALSSSGNPIYDSTGGVAGQPTVRFSAEALELDRPVQDDFTLLAVVSTLSTTSLDISTGDAWEMSPAVIGGADVGAGNNDDFHLGVNAGLTIFTLGGIVLTGITTVNDGAPHILEGARDSLGTGEIFVDGISEVFGFAGGTASLDGNDKTQIGASTPTQGFFDGDIHEVIILSELLTKGASVIDRVVLYNYLNSKYGIATSPDLYSLDTTHGSNVAGFGRFNIFDLSTSAEGPDIVQISNPSASSSGDFLFWGTDQPRVFTLSSNVPGAVTDRWARTWAIEETDGGAGDGIGTVDIRFRVNGLALPTIASSYALLTDTDLDFSDATAFTGGATYDAVAETITFSGFDPTGVTYFTLGFILP